MLGGSADTSGFHFPGGATGCLLLHGFTGSPWEMRFLGRRLREAGFTVSAVRLSGHATESRQEMLRSGWREWRASARAGFEALQVVCDRIVPVGQSMGALLAFALAREEPGSVAGVVALAPAFVLGDPRVRRFGRVLRWLVPVIPARWQLLAKGESDVLDPEVRRNAPRFPVPLRGVAELAALQRRVRRLLPEVRQPILVIHGRQDRTCPLENADLVRREAGTPAVRVHIAERSGHLVSVDCDREEVAALIADFVACVAVQPRPSP